MRQRETTNIPVDPSSLVLNPRHLPPSPYPRHGNPDNGLLRLHSTYRHDLKMYSSGASFSRDIFHTFSVSFSPRAALLLPHISFHSLFPSLVFSLRPSLSQILILPNSLHIPPK